MRSRLPGQTFGWSRTVIVRFLIVPIIGLGVAWAGWSGSALSAPAFQSQANNLPDAAMRRDTDAVRSLVAAGVEIDQAQPDGTTALHWAVRWDDSALAEFLLRSGASVDARNRLGVTPFFLAAENGSAPMIRLLVDAGADPAVPVTPSGETALMLATRTGSAPAIDVLLEHGAAVDARDASRGQTALMWAAAEGRIEALRALIRSGADANAQSTIRTVSTPSRNGSSTTSVVGGLTPLILASRQNDAAAVDALLTAGADVNLTTGDGTTALLLAITNGHYQLAMTLLENGADPNLADATGQAALFASIDRRNLETTDLPSPPVDDLDVKVLIEGILARGADTNARLTAKLPYRGGLNPTWLEEVGATPFYRAAASGDMDVMRMLLEHGADPGIAAADGTTPLMVAAGVGWLPGITFEWPSEDSLAALEACIALGNDVNAVNDDGLSALHGAAFRGWNDAVHILVGEGADLRAADSQGRLPVDWAEGVSFGGQSPRREEPTIRLLEELMGNGDSAELR